MGGYHAQNLISQLCKQQQVGITEMEDTLNACKNIYRSTFKATLGCMLRKLYERNKD